VFGENGETEKLKLKHGIGHIGHKFARGKMDSFDVKAPNVGTITKILIGHDNHGHQPGWLLSAVEIEVKALSKLFTFKANTWLDNSANKDTGGTHLEVELAATSRGLNAMELGESTTDGTPAPAYGSSTDHFFPEGTAAGGAHPGEHVLVKSPGKANRVVSNAMKLEDGYGRFENSQQASRPTLNLRRTSGAE
jgi:hypothetical protein